MKTNNLPSDYATNQCQGIEVPLNLSIFAQLAQGLPLKTFLDKESRLHSEDNVRHNRVDIRELDNLMIFLSYGTWRPNRVAFRDNPIVMDSPAQTN